MRFRILLAAVFFIGLVQASFGGIITNGQFALGGTVYVTDNTGRSTPAGTCASGDSCIFWQSGATATLNKADISVNGLPSGSGIGQIPLAISGNDAANISNLQNPPNIVDGVGFPNQTFVTFNNGGVTTQLLIDYIAAGIYLPNACADPPSVGQQCTTPGSLFNFVNNPSSTSTASWVMTGVTAGNPNPQQIWIGNFTAQFSTPYQTVFANLAANGYVSDTYSGTILLENSPAPEPGALIMIGSGLLGLGVLLRRRKIL